MPQIRSVFRAAIGAKGRAAMFSIALIALTLAPLAENFREEPRDSFPLSYYPMFSKKRSDEQRLTYLVGTKKDGDKRFLHYRYAGVGGMNQVRKQLRKNVREDQAAKVCEQAAQRVAERKSRSLRKVETVQIVTGRFRLQDFYDGRISPTRFTIEATAEVHRD